MSVTLIEKSRGFAHFHTEILLKEVYLALFIKSTCQAADPNRTISTNQYTSLLPTTYGHKLTANHHSEDCENLLQFCGWGHVAKANRRKRRESEVQARDVARLRDEKMKERPPQNVAALERDYLSGALGGRKARSGTRVIPHSMTGIRKIKKEITGIR